MRLKEYIGFILLGLIYGISLNEGATVIDLRMKYRLMKLEIAVDQMRNDKNKLKEKVVALEQQDLQQSYQMRILEEQIKTMKEANIFYPGQDVPRTCHELWRMGETVDGEYEVDPDGGSNGQPPIKVECSFFQDGANTKLLFDGVDFNKTLDLNATSCHGPGCYNVKINYTSPISQIVALIDLSKECQQPIEYGCESAPLEVNGHPMGWWTDRESIPQYYWINTTENKHICSCGLDDSCAEHETFENLCNCDANLPIKETDQGYIRNSSALPITELSAGTFYGKASFSLGHMECFGEAPYNNGESCDAYRKAGATPSGYYLTMPSGNSTNSTNVPHVSLCDMSKSSKDPDFQTDIGALGEFGHNGQGLTVAFNAVRSSPFTQANTNITFDKATVNIGDAFDPDTGTFIAPVDGLYHFTFHGFSNGGYHYSGSNHWSKFHIYKNNAILATAIANNYYYSNYSQHKDMAYQSFSTSFYEFLNSGDSIYVKIGSYGQLYDSSSEHVTQFSGSLMQ